MTQPLETVRAFLEAACRAEENRFGYGIWTHHILVVVRYGHELSAITGADAEIVELAALLHDYAGIKDVALEPQHHLHGADEARRLLGSLAYPPQRTEHIAACILTHRARAGDAPGSLEAHCLRSADALAHLTQVPSLLRLAYAEKGLGVDEGAAWVAAKLKRSYAKLMPGAVPLAETHYRAALEVLERS